MSERIFGLPLVIIIIIKFKQRLRIHGVIWMLVKFIPLVIEQKCIYPVISCVVVHTVTLELSSSVFFIWYYEGLGTLNMWPVYKYYYTLRGQCPWQHLHKYHTQCCIYAIGEIVIQRVAVFLPVKYICKCHLYTINLDIKHAWIKHEGEAILNTCENKRHSQYPAVSRASTPSLRTNGSIYIMCMHTSDEIVCASFFFFF